MSLQVVSPRIRGFLSMTAHPEGCAANVREQIAIAKAAATGGSLGTVLVVGNSTGYGLASALSACFAYGADVLGVCFEKAADAKRTATAGWYNCAAAAAEAAAVGRRFETINGDAFSHEVKETVVGALRDRFAAVDLVIYSLASPRRTDPDNGTIANSVLKPIGPTFSGKTIDLRSGAVTEASIEPASEAEIADTVKVMGGEDWRLWVDALQAADLLAPGCRSVAYSYIGPEVTMPIYRNGTIGKAKEDLEATGRELNDRLAAHCQGGAWVSVNKALVTQASAAIPVVPLYISILLKVMQEQGTHEGTAEQIARLYARHLGPDASPSLDEAGRIRLDDWEMASAVQEEVNRRWQAITRDNLAELADYDKFQADFAQLFGFGRADVDYAAEVETERPLNVC